jgi:hypothetical protein
VKERRDLTLDFWRQNVDALLSFQGKTILQGRGRVSNAQMEEHVKSVYSSFEATRHRHEAELADAMEIKELEGIEKMIEKNRK